MFRGAPRNETHFSIWKQAKSELVVQHVHLHLQVILADDLMFVQGVDFKWNQVVAVPPPFVKSFKDTKELSSITWQKMHCPH